ncbi:MAG TPA: acylphosphatase [Gemmata sp.]|nr:acylphosphatase [Gemmata sp.]
MARLVYYSGHVQGVGFRATVYSIARRHPVRGWVKNLADGRVEVLADGQGESIEAFLEEIRTAMAGYIRGEDIFDRDPDETLDAFRISY